MTVPNNKKEELFNRLSQANNSFNEIYPGDRSERQPVHTLYGGANLFKHDAPIVLGHRALEVLETYAPNHEVFGKALGLMGGSDFSKRIYDKVVAKLKSE